MTEIIIRDEVPVIEIKEKFNQVFPFLKLEILEHPIEKGRIVNDNHTLGKYRKENSFLEEIIITSKQKVYELKQLFKKIYGLIIQVFRKMGEVWLEATSTMDWTFEKQNDETIKINKF